MTYLLTYLLTLCGLAVLEQYSQPFKALSSRCKKISGCKLSGPGAMPALSVLTAVITSLVKKSFYKSWSADGEFHSIFSWRLTFLVNSRFGCLNLTFCITYEETALGFIQCGFSEIFFLPVSLLIIAQALRLECFMPMFLSVFFHAALGLLLRCSDSSFRASCLSGMDCAFSRPFSKTIPVESQPGI